jgi:hypothetical protein
MYLILERHFEIFRVCQTRTVHPLELDDAADTLSWVFRAVNIRLELLQCQFFFQLHGWFLISAPAIFKQQKLDLKQQFKSFSFGLVRGRYGTELLNA